MKNADGFWQLFSGICGLIAAGFAFLKVVEYANYMMLLSIFCVMCEIAAILRRKLKP